VSTTARRAGSGVARIGVATALASLAGYALLALVGRTLGPAEFGLFVAFWGVLFGVGSSLSTIEQETARRAASEVPEEAGPPVSAVTTAAAAIAGLAAAATLLPPVANRLYGEAGSWIGLVVVVAALGFAAQFAVRGLLIGSGHVRDYSLLVVAEATVRLIALLAFLALLDLDLQTAAVAVAAGSFAWLAWAVRARSALPGRGLSRTVWLAATARAGSLMLGAALTASVITGFPTLVTVLTDGAPGAAGGAVFAAITVSRLPLLLLSPVQAVAVPVVVRAHARTGTEGPATLRKGLVLGSVLAVALGAAAAAVAWVAGPWVVRLVYGDAYVIAAPAVALLVLSACLLAWTQLLSAALIALAAHRGMLAMWALAVAATGLWLLVSPLDIVATTAIGSLVGPLAALACAFPLLWRLART
jgi:O-antigen/teichoic acid export membrane protein